MLLLHHYDFMEEVMIVFDFYQSNLDFDQSNIDFGQSNFDFDQSNIDFDLKIQLLCF
jgi:hypothetical protein